MSYAEIFGTKAGAASTTDDATTPEVDSSGSSLIFISVGFSAVSPAAITILDTYENEYRAEDQISTGSSNYRGGQVFSCENPITGPGHSFTATADGAAMLLSITVQGFSGTAARSSRDQVSHNFNADGNTVQPGAITPSVDNALILIGFASIQTSASSIDSGFTKTQAELTDGGFQHASCFIAYKVQTTATAVNPTITAPSSNGLVATILSFKPFVPRPDIGLPADSDEVPKAGVLFWHEARSLVEVNALADAGDVSKVYDYSANAIDLGCSSSNPTLDIDGANGKPAVSFSGTSNPLVSELGTIDDDIYHLFVVAGYADATFAGNNSPIGPAGTGIDVLYGNGSGQTKFANRSFGGGFIYKKNDVAFAESNELAPMSGQLAVMELVFPSGVNLEDVQVGKTLAFADKWKGLWTFDIAYKRVLTDAEVLAVYRYAAKISYVWQQDAAGNDVFPFYSNRSMSAETAQERYLSEPYNGDPVALVRGDARDSLSLNFMLRSQAEFQAAKAFHRTHIEPTKSVFRDYRYLPPLDRTVRIVSNLRERGDDTSFRFNYSFDVQEV